MGTSTGLLGSSFIYTPETGSVRVSDYDPYSTRHPSFNTTGKGSGFNEQGLVALQKDAPAIDPVSSSEEARDEYAGSVGAGELYGDVLAGYEGLRDPVTSAVGAAQANDLYASIIEGADAPAYVSAEDYYAAMKDTLESMGIDTTELAEAAGASLEADSDLMGDLDTIVDSVAQNGSTDVSGGSTETVEDVRETWTYDKATDSFISTVRGDSIPRTGDADVPLRDGGEYSVRPVAGTEGVTAEHVVDEESGESVGAFTIDILTGLPTLKKITDETVITDTTDTAVNGTADVGPAAPTGVDDSGTATGGGISVTGTLSGDKYAGVSRNGGGTLVLNTAGTDGTDGADGQDGADGKDGRDGKDGKDGLTGLLALSSIATPIADEIFTREFKMDYLKPEFIGLLDLNKGRTS
jgi:hypothetical protein